MTEDIAHPLAKDGGILQNVELSRVLQKQQQTGSDVEYFENPV
jgi:hypothetical protein